MLTCRIITQELAEKNQEIKLDEISCCGLNLSQPSTKIFCEERKYIPQYPKFPTEIEPAFRKDPPSSEQRYTIRPGKSPFESSYRASFYNSQSNNESDTQRPSFYMNLATKRCIHCGNHKQEYKLLECDHIMCDECIYKLIEDYSIRGRIPVCCADNCKYQIPKDVLMSVEKNMEKKHERSGRF